MSLYAFHLGQIISTVLIMTNNMVYVPNPDSGTKSLKMTTPFRTTVTPQLNAY